MFPMGNIQTEDPSYGTVEDIELGIPLGQAEKVYGKAMLPVCNYIFSLDLQGSQKSAEIKYPREP